MDVWLLPGLDGTGRLFAPLVTALDAERVDPRVIAYPTSAARYDAVLESVPVPTQPTLLVAESFSGPVAVRLATLAPRMVRGIVFVASFVRSPLSLVVRGGLLELAMAMRPPRIALRLALLGLDAPSAVVELARETIGGVPARTMAARVAAVADVDVRREFAALETPMLWLRASRDRLVSAHATTLAARARPGLEVQTIEGPHLLAQVRPAAIAAIIAARAR